MYGITQEKQEKYSRRVRQLIKLYSEPASSDYHDVELLRLRLGTFTSRVVYVSKYSSGNVWKTKGFVSNYSELRYFEEGKTLEKQTADFLKIWLYGNFNARKFQFRIFGNVCYKRCLKKEWRQADMICIKI